MSQLLKQGVLAMVYLLTDLSDFSVTVYSRLELALASAKADLAAIGANAEVTHETSGTYFIHLIGAMYSIRLIPIISK